MEASVPSGDASRGIPCELLRARDVHQSITKARRSLYIDFAIYLVFLVAFMIATLVPFVPVAWHGFQLVKVINVHMGTLEWPDPSRQFYDIAHTQDFWSWWNGPFKAVLYGLDPFDPDGLTEDNGDPKKPPAFAIPGYLLNSVIVGSVRLRQQRAPRESDCASEKAQNLRFPAVQCYPTMRDGAQSTYSWDWPRFRNSTTYPSDDFLKELAEIGAAASAVAKGNRTGPGGRNEMWDVGARAGTEAPEPAPGPTAAAAAPAQAPPGSGSRRLLDHEGKGLPKGAPVRAAVTPQRLSPNTAPGNLKSILRQHRERTVAQLAERRRLLDAEGESDEDTSIVSDGSYNIGTDGSSDLTRNRSEVYNEMLSLAAKTPAFTYRSHEELSDLWLVSKDSLHRYDGGGFAHDFSPKNLTGFLNVSEILRDLAWIDAATRLVVVEMVLYSPPTQLYCGATFMVEQRASGHMMPSARYEVFQQSLYQNNRLSYGLVAVEGVFVILCFIIFAFDIRSMIQARHDVIRVSAWRNPFFIMSMSSAGLTITLIVFRGIRLSKSNFDPADVMDGSDPWGSNFPTIYELSWDISVERGIVAFLAFLVWLRVLKYTERLPVFGTIGRTMRRAFPQTVIFLFMSLVVFYAFAQAFYLGFYSTNDGFQTLVESMVSMVRFVAGNVDYTALYSANNVLAPLLYTIALFVLGFVWTSMMLAIVIQAYYAEVEDERAFKFDKVFEEFSVNNDIVKQHPEYDRRAMAGRDGQHVLTPEHYHRYVLAPLALFHQGGDRPMFSMTMCDFLAGSDTDVLHATQQITQTFNGVFDMRWAAELIIVRLGHRRGAVGRHSVEAQALYFPRTIHESQARLWWEAHKHLLRIGDGVYRYLGHLQKQAPKQVQQLLVGGGRAVVDAGRNIGTVVTRLQPSPSTASNAEHHHNHDSPSMLRRRSIFSSVRSARRNATGLDEAAAGSEPAAAASSGDRHDVYTPAPSQRVSSASFRSQPSEASAGGAAGAAAGPFGRYRSAVVDNMVPIQESQPVTQTEDLEPRGEAAEDEEAQMATPSASSPTARLPKGLMSRVRAIPHAFFWRNASSHGRHGTFASSGDADGTVQGSLQGELDDSSGAAAHALPPPHASYAQHQQQQIDAGWRGRPGAEAARDASSSAGVPNGVGTNRIVGLSPFARYSSSEQASRGLNDSLQGVAPPDGSASAPSQDPALPQNDAPDVSFVSQVPRDSWRRA